MKTVDVFPGSSKLVEGIVPKSSMLLMGPSGIGKTIFAKQFTYNGLLNGETCIYVSTDEPHERVIQTMKSLGFEIEEFVKSDKFRVVDAYSWKLEKSPLSKYAVKNPSNLLDVLKTVDDARDSLTNIRLVLDSITGLTSICEHSMLEIVRLLQLLVARITSSDSNAIFIAVPEAHDPQLVSHFRLIFDGILEMRQDETSKQIKRLFRIFSLKGAKHATTWTPFEITEKGIILVKENQLRCEMCARTIEWEPYTELIAGEKHVFDRPECARTYRKLKGVYGKNFE